ncbi:MAG: DUF4145 domain-containing protein [Firmicutes bacterium]|nr:DUF4145 domain-containing protein [Bacillota bacterium]
MARYQEIPHIENYDKIASKLDTAERLLESDPDMAVTAMRTASELMLKQLCVKYTGSEGEDNSERINTLEKQGVIDSSICRSLHRIRLTANDSLHEAYEVADYDAEIWYDSVLTLAAAFVNEVDPDGTVNRGVKLGPGKVIVPESERVTDGFGMAAEERLELLKSTAVQVRRFAEKWQDHESRLSQRDRNNSQRELKERLEIPEAVQEYFISYWGVMRVGGTRALKYGRPFGFSYESLALKPYVLKQAEASPSVILPESDVWDYVDMWQRDYDAGPNVEDPYILVENGRSTANFKQPSELLNEAFVGGDGTGRRPMHLTEKVKELTLPDEFDKFDDFELPRDLPFLLIFFPRLEKVTWKGETWETGELIRACCQRWIETGSFRQYKPYWSSSAKIKLSSLPGWEIPDARHTTRAYYMIPRSLFELGNDALYFLSTLHRFYPELHEGPPAEYKPLDTDGPEVREYILGIEGEPAGVEYDRLYPPGLEDGISCYKDPSGLKKLDPRDCQEYYLDPYCFLLLPDWAYEGARALGTGIKEFMEAVIKIRPELFDSYQPELHVKPEPVPAPEPAPAAALAPPVPEPETEPEPEPAPVIRFCPYCGAPAEGYRFCAKCGRQLLK